MIDRVRGAFAALATERAAPPGELRVVALNADDDVYVGVDHDRRLHVLLAGDEGEFDVVGTTAITVTTRTLDLGSGARDLLDCACVHMHLADVFEQFVVAVLGHARSTKTSPASAAAAVINRWREFLTAPSEPVGRGAAAAVIAELLVLRDVVAVDRKRSIDAWVGGQKARHDFRRGGLAVEVKMTTSHTARIVTIHGEDQLDVPSGGDLYIHLVRLESVAGGRVSIGVLVESLLEEGVAADDLFRALGAYGIAATGASDREWQFEVRERLTVPVNDDTPRIVPASFAGAARPLGVVDMSYRVDLDHVLTHALDDAAYKDMIGRLAVEPV